MSASRQPPDDAPPQGAADFYFAIQATFRFLWTRLGVEALRRYWTDLGREYFAPVSNSWRQGGFPAVAQYWRDFFAAEPGAKVDVVESADGVTLDVRVCPAIAHLRRNGRPVLPCFCQHCYFVGEAMAASAEMTVRVSGGNGACRQRFLRRDRGEPAQDLMDIHEVTPC
jgi:hypothetical protein